MPSAYAPGGPNATPDIHGALGTARRAINMGSPGMASEMVSPKAADLQSRSALLARVGFILTNLEADSRAVVRFYNKRGTAEQ